MAQRTTNLDLVLPVQAEDVLVQDVNGNMTKIDTFAGQTNQALTNLGNKVAMYAATINFGGSNAVKFTRSVQHQNFIIDVSSYSGSPGYIVASNGALSNFSLTAKAAWNSDQTQLTVVSSTYRRCLVLSDSPITYELLNVDYSSFADVSSFNMQNVAMKEQLGNLVMLTKASASSAADLTFTASGRGAGFLIVTQNGLQSSIYEIHTTSNSGALQFTKIGGRDVTITANDNVLTVSVTNWSNVYVIYGGSIS